MINKVLSRTNFETPLYFTSFKNNLLLAHEQTSMQAGTHTTLAKMNIFASLAPLIETKNRTIFI